MEFFRGKETKVSEKKSQLPSNHVDDWTFNLAAQQTWIIEK